MADKGTYKVHIVMKNGNLHIDGNKKLRIMGVEKRDTYVVVALRVETGRCVEEIDIADSVE